MSNTRKPFSFRLRSRGLFGSEDRRMRAHIDVPLIVITYLFALFGVYCIAIATFDPSHGTDLSVINYILNSRSASWQSVFLLVSVLELVFMIFIPYDLLRSQGRLVYYGILALLVVALTTEAFSGVTSWIPIGKGRTIQPAEFIKIGIILMLARTLGQEEVPCNNIQSIIHNFGIFLLPAAITLLQGELGSVLVMAFVFFVMLYFSGARARLLILLLVFAVAGVAVIIAVWTVTNPDSYRLQRLLSFVDPQSYYSSAGYQILNSQMAIGSGGREGIGTFLVGSLSQLDYVPEDWTDFIFSAIGEAFGFRGCSLILLGYLCLVFRMLYLAYFTQDRFGRLTIYGVTAMFVAHIVENIGMTVGLLPITGIPLPFLSYGGSNFVTNIAGIGLILNVVRNRSNFMALHNLSGFDTDKKKRRSAHRRARKPFATR